MRLLYFVFITFKIKAIFGKCDLNGKIIKGVTIEEPPHTMIDEKCMAQNIDKTSCVSGMVMDIITEVAQSCNFKLQLHVTSKDSIFGDVEEINGSLITSGLFNGFETPYQEGDFDFIANPVVMKSIRTKIVDYTVPYQETRFVIVIKNDLNHQNHWFMYTSIMSKEVWFLMFLTLFIPSILLSIEEILIQKKKFSLKTFVINFYASFTVNFGGNFLGNQRTVPRITALAFHLCYGIIIWMYFRGVLTSRLTERHHDLPFRNLAELSKTNYELITGTGYSASVFTEAQKDTDYFKVYSKMNNHSFMGLKPALEKLYLNENIAVHFFDYDIKYLISRQNKTCDTLIPFESDLKKYFSIPFRKNFTHFKEINKVFKKMRESGQIQRKVQRYLDKQDICTEEISIGYEQVLPLFLILIISGGLGLVILALIEFPWRKISQKNYQ